MKAGWDTHKSERTVTVTWYGSLIETWYFEPVNGMGPMWVCYPAGHADPTDFSDVPPSFEEEA